MALSHSPKIVTDGLVLYLDAGNSKSYSGSGTTWYDLSKKPTSIPITSTVTYDTNKYFSFDGSGYINSEWGEGVNPYTNPFSFSLWIKPNNVANNRMFFSTTSLGTNQRAYFGHYNGKWDMGIQEKYWGNGVNTATNNWTNITIVFEGTTASMYINGIFSIGKSYTSYSLITDFAIGGGISSYYWDGLISNLSIYNKVLSEEEIKQNFNALRGRYGI